MFLRRARPAPRARGSAAPRSGARWGQALGG
uniref:Uncharacterized protein n=1 Tax=Arundo donax TaxID=35708 RepID=A0A0A9FN41_ARUDO